MGSRRSPNKPTAIALIALIYAAQPMGAWAATPDDPYEGMNRAFYAFHRALDAAIFGPAARAYKAVLPEQLRKGFRNVITNLKEPSIAANDLLQAHPDRTAKTVARFVINSTVGIAGVFDFAHDMGFVHHDNGFGATAGRYNVQPGPYLFIPLVGPTNFRDFLGYIADAVTDPLAFQPFHDGQVIYARALVDGLDQRAQADEQLRAIDDMSTDPYASLRSLFEQNRAGQIQDAVTGRTGSAEPVFQDFDDPGAAPVSAPPPPEVKPSAVIDSIVNARLNKPLRLMAPDMVTGELVPVFVESPQAG